jgi:hypothetical protein
MKIALFFSLVALVACCPSPAPGPAGPPSPEPVVEVPLPAPTAEPSDAAPDRAAAGAACVRADDCESGICEGEGCEGNGVCAALDRACTKDLAPYCGCDGVTFSTSGSCPGKRFRHRGACESGASGAVKADGESCGGGAECASGICEGQGCGPNAGRCAPKDRMCTFDLATYCGCDGLEFQASGSCPGRLYQKRGRC